MLCKQFFFFLAIPTQFSLIRYTRNCLRSTLLFVSDENNSNFYELWQQMSYGLSDSSFCELSCKNSHPDTLVLGKLPLKIMFVCKVRHIRMDTEHAQLSLYQGNRYLCDDQFQKYDAVAQTHLKTWAHIYVCNQMYLFLYFSFI